MCLTRLRLPERNYGAPSDPFMPIPLLIVDDEQSTRDGLQSALSEKYDVYTAESADAAFDLMGQIEFEVVLTDLRMVGKSGLKVIDKVLTLPQKPAVIMMTAYGNVETAVEAMRRGASDFIQKPLNLEALEMVIARALKARQLETENVQLRERLSDKFSFESFVGASNSLKKLVDEIKLVAPSRASILLVGPTGSGKELAAQAIHQNSPRSQEAFVAVHCAALPAALLESELFGHERGAFTGASERRIGRFEKADKGTIFLDEIGEIDPVTQVKLLRFLETHTFERLGSSDPIKVDVRLVAATNRDLEKMVLEGKFREDLYYRLNVVKLILPPLKERREDIPLLMDFFFGEFAKENGVRVPLVSPEAGKILMAYEWSGNVRELKNFCERMVVLKRGGKIERSDLEEKFFSAPAGKAADSLSVKENEERLIGEALAKTRGNKSKAAALMGISRRTLHRKLKEQEK